MSILAVVLPQIIATPSPGTSPLTGFSLPLKDVITILISLASFCFAVAAFIKTTFEQRRKLILDQLVAEITTLDDLSISLVKQVESILTTCHHSNLPPFDSYLATLHDFRKADSHLDNLELLLPQQGDAIHRQFVDWHRALTSDRFPVLVPKHKYSISDARFTSVAEAQTIWRRYLFSLRLSCLRNQIKYWKTK